MVEETPQEHTVEEGAETVLTPDITPANLTGITESGTRKIMGAWIRQRVQEGDEKLVEIGNHLHDMDNQKTDMNEVLYIYIYDFMYIFLLETKHYIKHMKLLYMNIISVPKCVIYLLYPLFSNGRRIRKTFESERYIVVSSS